MEDSTGATVTILDHIDNLTVPGNVFAEPVNEYWALVWLHQGMDYLYRQVRRFDDIVTQQVNPSGTAKFECWGNAPFLNNVPQALITCGFHWYAISACQYVRTVGAIAYQHDNHRPLPIDYAKAIIPEVIAFRNKVAAHFAWCTSNKNDNNAERFASILPTLIFRDNSFHVGSLTVHLCQESGNSNSKSIQSWSLSRVHESLCKRYWPEIATETKQELLHAKSEEKVDNTNSNSKQRALYCALPDYPI
jgi:hypothetical protein